MTDGSVPPALKPLADLSLADQAYSALREAILDLRLKPGDALVEQKLAAALGTSKTPIRQALHRLEQTGLVRATPGRGYYVAPLSLRDAHEILAIRAVLEGLAAELACARLSEADLHGLGDLLREAEDAYARGEAARSVELGHGFHQALIDAADNDRLVFLIGVLSDQYRRVRLVSNQNLARVPRSIAEHAAVFRALEARDATETGQAMRRHLMAVYDDLQHDGALAERPVSVVR
jgi:DNA-binding GntR family transcriptional regulator